jgi:hypothetical protein
MPLGDAVETFIRREDAERFIEEVRSDDPGLASYVRIEERELEAGGDAVATIARASLIAVSTPTTYQLASDPVTSPRGPLDRRLGGRHAVRRGRRRGTPELEVVAAVRSSEDPVRALHRPR